MPVRTELIDGVIYEVSPRDAPHINALRVLNRYTVRGLDPAIYAVQVQDPITTAGWKGPHAPEVDLAVVRAQWYATIADAADTFAAIEVADTTYTDDRTAKIPLYEVAGIPAWIVDIRERRVEFYPVAGECQTFQEHQVFEVLGVSIPVSELFGPPEA